jgi:hypothetical protein
MTWLTSLYHCHAELVGPYFPRAGAGELRTARDLHLDESDDTESYRQKNRTQKEQKDR